MRRVSPSRPLLGRKRGHPCPHPLTIDLFWIQTGGTMDENRFDDLARSVADENSSRRGVFKLLGGAAVGAAALFGGVKQASAVTCRTPGNVCSKDADCCSGSCIPSGNRKVCAELPACVTTCIGATGPSGPAGATGALEVRPVQVQPERPAGPVLLVQREPTGGFGATRTDRESPDRRAAQVPLVRSDWWAPSGP